MSKLAAMFGKDGDKEEKKINDDLRRKYFDDKRVEFETGCAAGDKGACYSLGEWWLHFGKDSAKAKEYMSKSCYEQNHGNACFTLAQLYQGNQFGEDEEVCKAKTFELNKRACEAGNVQGCGMAGSCAMHGFGCKKDVAKAEQYFREACKGNDALACFKLGRLFLDGLEKHGVERNPAEAAKHMAKGCDLGHPNCCQVLSVMYKKGDGVEADATKHEKYRERTMAIIQQAGQAMGATVV